MEKLHSVMRSISENKSDGGANSAKGRDHMTVFREFLDTLDRVTRQRAAKSKTKATKAKSRRRR